MSQLYLYYGNLFQYERQFSIPQFMGLALYPKHDREIQHDALNRLPFPDGSALKVQAQDVFEHLPFERLPSVMDDIYRVLVKGGVFRLSVPDYRCSVLKNRSVYDWRGKVIADTMMGAKVGYDPKSTAAKVELTNDGHAHLWFPTYESVLHLIVRSEIRKANKIVFYQYFRDEETYVCDEVPENEMFVTRSHPNDSRCRGKPISIIVDFIK